MNLLPLPCRNHIWMLPNFGDELNLSPNRLPSYYGDGMVFQHDAAVAWGYSDCDPGEVMAEVLKLIAI